MVFSTRERDEANIKEMEKLILVMTMHGSRARKTKDGGKFIGGIFATKWLGTCIAGNR